MNPNKNAKTYLIKYIKTQNPDNQQEKQTAKHKESLSYRIYKQINIRKTTISSRGKQKKEFRQTRKEYPLKQKRKSKRNRKIKT